ncbi:2-amino-4-hydroxy-6-hydroxymethyldihydropteridine diphosphokinase [Listeria grayi]|uniref:2-amino-4-hydroxy-6-hydroxymethyldihydropteridine diphosphokinase n=1 Tax=Listeria grayi DSM 20601 TaxID=525367 RepID=D7UUG9_LISGR|nr:2-amino-4-hydroxy-6-hydroxymethyldihydropteridine diphosphokinase [Listeria grayi]EFI84895.1 2-amino-4-hydroxy-6-hydroxymethyldihydropteridine diphosphokinase [Listeria grayi DSM 20601]
MAKVYLSIGTNMGERETNLEAAVVGLKDHPQIKVVGVSSIYETDPVGYEDQASFLNIAVEIATSLAPHDLLTFCLALEKKIGRVRLFKWGPRLIDIDILLYDDQIIQTEDLIVPHPLMKERAFVMIPLLEIAPELAGSIESQAVLAEQGIKKTKNQVNW